MGAFLVAQIPVPKATEQGKLGRELILEPFLGWCPRLGARCLPVLLPKRPAMVRRAVRGRLISSVGNPWNRNTRSTPQLRGGSICSSAASSSQWPARASRDSGCCWAEAEWKLAAVIPAPAGGSFGPERSLAGPDWGRGPG